MTTHHSSGIKQLLSLQAQLNSLISAYSTSESPNLRSLDDIDRDHDDSSPQDPKLEEISATLQHLLALVHGERHAFLKAFEFHVTVSLSVAVEAHVEESLREAAESGINSLSAVDLAKPTGVDPDKLARSLRLIAAYHVFVETAPSTFSRNRCSSILDTGKSIQELTKDPLEMYASEKGGIGAVICHFAQEGMRVGSYSTDAILRPNGPTDHGCSRAFNGDDFWTFLAREENERYRKRFACAMQVVGKAVARGEGVVTGFPWKDLPEGSIIVDVGGGKGQVSKAIAEAVPHLKFVVQDRPEVIDTSAIPYWETSASPELRARVQLTSHDFFTDQPIKAAGAYILRHVIHDWPEEESIKILSQLSKASSESSKLIIIESFFETLASPNAPITAMPYLLDIQMLSIVNAQERTEEQYKSLASQAGWKYVKTWKTGENKEGTFRHYEFEKDV